MQVARSALAAPTIGVLCTERFDRERVDSRETGAVRKLHQEDFCQALGVEPGRKYQFDGGPALGKCAQIVTDHSGLPGDDLQRLVRWVGFNYVIGNEDAHAKNLAVLYREDGIRLAPHYDLLSTEIYRDLERQAAMKIGGSWDLRDVKRTDWKRLAKAIRLPWNRTRALLLGLHERTAAACETVAHECVERYGASPVYEQITDLISRQLARMSRELV